MKYSFAALLSLLILFSVFSCKPDDEVVTRDGSAKLEFSQDSVFFDTVFVSTGSVTKRLKVYNRNKNAVKIDEIKLEKLGDSRFDLIVNGQQTDVASNITLRGEDSLLVLVKVFINPNDKTLPFIVEDKISFLSNGNIQKIDVIAYGQNARFYRNTEICTETWDNTLPYVLFDTIVVKENCKLTIKEGVKVYVHNNSGLYVLGTLDIQGTKDKKVLFRNDRLDSLYNDVPGLWGGIFILRKSRNNRIQYAEIKNATFGLSIQNNEGNQTIIENTVVRNMFVAGLLGVRANIKVTNSLFTNCGQYAVVGLGGGTYNLDFCTIANYSPRFTRKNEAVGFNDTVDLGPPVGIVVNPSNITITNSIIWNGTRNGSLQDEIVFLTRPNVSQVSISNSILQTNRYKTALANNGNKINEDPKFAQPGDGSVPARKINYSLKTGSPAINAASAATGISTDLRGETRPQGQPNPDMGAYESSE